MPHIPPQFRPPPDSYKKPPVGDSIPPSMPEPVSGDGVPKDRIYGSTPKPVVRHKPQPKLRGKPTFKMTETLSISSWDIDPGQVARDIGAQ
jgi:hypothetical protein